MLNRLGWSAAWVFVVLIVSGALLSASDREEIYKVGGDVSAPKLVHKEQPKYPKQAKKARITGTVVLSAVLNSKGVPESIQVVRSVDPDLDVEAARAASNWRFKPAEKYGKPVAVNITMEITFRLCCSAF